MLTISIMRAWMKRLGCPEGSDKWFGPYYSTSSEWAKAKPVAAFKIEVEHKIKCVILVATEYGHW